MSSERHIVVLGGGNGTSRLLEALKPLLDEEKIASLHAVVSMADDGGSSGMLRKDYGVAPMGDLTNCLVALSGWHGDVRGDKFLQALKFRFPDGGLQGHSMRNLMLAAMELTSDIDTAIATMARVLQIPKYSGVVPIVLQALTQQVFVEDGGDKKILGEGQHFLSHNVDMQADSTWKAGDVRVGFAEDDVVLNPRAEEVLKKASHIIIAPGHTYGTILSVLATVGLREIIENSSAQLVAVGPLLTTPRQTTGWTGEDFIRVYASYLGRMPDMVIANNSDGDVELEDGQDWVRFEDADHAFELITNSLVSTQQQKGAAGDTVPRAIAIHDSETLREILKRLLGV